VAGRSARGVLVVGAGRPDAVHDLGLLVGEVCQRGRHEPGERQVGVATTSGIGGGEGRVESGIELVELGFDPVVAGAEQLGDPGLVGLEQLQAEGGEGQPGRFRVWPMQVMGPPLLPRARRAAVPVEDATGCCDQPAPGANIGSGSTMT
jgi:hypothetical protein